MKKGLKVLSVIICVVLLFVSGYSIGTLKSINVGINGIPSGSSASTATQTTAATPVTAQPETTQPAAPTTAETSAAPAEAPAQESGNSTEQIVQTVSDAINKLKSEQNFTGRKSEKTVININECSASALTNPLNSICQNFAGEKLSTYEFKNGSAVGIGDDGKERNNGDAVSPKEAIQPKGEDFSLSASGVKEATAVQNGDSTTYTIKLVSETSTVDSAPSVNKGALGYLNVSGFSVPTVSVTKADINYPESVLTVTIDSQGRVTNLKIDQPMDGSMGAKIAIISGDVMFDGGSYETWDITY